MTSEWGNEENERTRRVSNKMSGMVTLGCKLWKDAWCVSYIWKYKHEFRGHSQEFL